ncbi:MAG TPA: histidine phosphatase family protein [Candidatus Woesearchaeota archaeon]|nr:histidine phosphatase family protein [Candidatus Woesearchaeota archaeon]
MELFITRHPLTEENKKRIIQSHQDGNISKEGKIELTYLIRRLRKEKIGKVYSSDSPRCVYACEKIAQGLKIPFEFTECLREYNRGDLIKAGENIPEWGSINIPSLDWVPNNGESITQLYERIELLLEKIGINSNKKVLFITHSFVAKAIVSKILGLEVIESAKRFSISNCSLTRISFRENVNRIMYLNSCDFLKD